MQSLLVERFTKGMKKIIPDYSDHNKPLNYLVINYILNDINNEWVGSDIDQEINKELLITVSYICVTY